MRDPSPQRKTRSLWPWLLLVASISLWMVADHDEAELVPVGRAAPALDLAWTGPGERFSLEAHRGQVVVLAFWATWCPACRREAPTLRRIHERLARRGGRVVGVSVDEGPLEAIARTAQRFEMTYPIARATRDDITRYGVELLPTIYVVGSDGRIAASFVGGVGESRLREAVDAAP